MTSSVEVKVSQEELPGVYARMFSLDPEGMGPQKVNQLLFEELGFKVQSSVWRAAQFLAQAFVRGMDFTPLVIGIPDPGCTTEHIQQSLANTGFYISQEALDSMPHELNVEGLYELRERIHKQHRSQNGGAFSQ